MRGSEGAASAPSPAATPHPAISIPPVQRSDAAKMEAVPWAPHPSSDSDHGLDQVAEVLDPVLTPLGFAPGQAGASKGRGQVIFCRGEVDSTDGGCVDLVVDVEATPEWRIIDVRYWGYPSDRWHLDFDPHADLSDQLKRLAQTLPKELV